MIIYRYFLLSILRSFVTVTGVFTAVLTISLFINDYDLLHTLTWWHLFIYCSYEIIIQLLDLSPIILVLSCLSSLTIMAHHNELIIWCVNGLSAWQILNKAFVIVGILALIILLIREFNIPLQIKNFAVQENGLLDGQANYILAYRDKRYIHIHSLSDAGLAQNVTLWQPDSEHKRLVKKTTIAKMYYLLDQSTWLQTNIAETSYYPTQIKQSIIDQRLQPALTDAKSLETMQHQTNQLPLRMMKKIIDQRENKATKFKWILWERLLTPLKIYSLILLTCSLSFISNRSMEVKGKIIIALSIIALFFAIQYTILPISILYHLPVLLCMIVLIVLTSIVGVYNLRRY